MIDIDNLIAERNLKDIIPKYESDVQLLDIIQGMRDKQRLYEIALNETNINIWEYDLINNRLIYGANFDQTKILIPATDKVTENMPDALVENNNIHPSSINTYYELEKRLRSGEKNVTVDIRWCDSKKDRWYWSRFICTNFFNELNEPVRAIIINEDITNQKEAEIVYQQEMRISHEESSALIKWRVNYSKNRIDLLEGHDVVYMSLNHEMCYEQILQAESKHLINENERKKFLDCFAMSNLLKNLEEGRSIVSMEARRAIGNGKIIWTNTRANIMQDIENGDIYVYCSVYDINTQKSIEKSLKQKAEKDELTGAYNKKTAVMMMRDAFSCANMAQKPSAILIFNLDNFRELIAKNHYGITDDILKTLARQIQDSFTSHKVLGRFYSDEFVLFVGEDVAEDILKRKAEKIKKILSMSYLSQTKPNVSVSVGIAINDRFDDDLKVLYENAKIALNIAKDEGKNRCVVYTYALDDKNKSGIKDKIFSIDYQQDEKEMLFQLAFDLVSAEDFDAAVKNLLREIKDFYGAHFACIFGLQNSNEISGLVKKWQNTGIIADNKLNLQLMYVALNHSQDCKKEIFLENIAELRKKDELLEEMNGVSLESLCIFPLAMNGKRIGFLALQNLTKNTESLDILKKICYFIVSSMDKIQTQERNEYLNTHDKLTGLLNHNSYLKYISELDESRLISLGVIIADINGLKKINMQYGSSYGDTIIIEASKILQNEFDLDFIYRFSGDEFLIICHDLTYNIFEKKTNRIKDTFKERMSGLISIGNSWSDNEINFETVLKHADERMMLKKKEYYNESKEIHKDHDPAMLKKLLGYLQENCFKLYLQPKVEVQISRVNGAEALVRMVHPEKGFITPDKFVPQLEKNGFISYLDFFMFEEVCRILKKWQDEGKELITISVNFSRSTILTEDLIEKMLTIYNKYNVPKDKIEIEITETIGEFERESIVQIGHQIVAEGFRLSLDDFGARYSNLSVLSAMKLHVLKLDKCLVDDLSSKPNTRIVMKNFLLTCKELGIKSVAEGVETEEQMDVLKELGCDAVQGYLINKPIPAHDFEEKYMEERYIV